MHNFAVILINSKSQFHFQGHLFKDKLPDTVSLGLQRGAMGLLFIALYQVFSIWLKESYLVSDEFDVSIRDCCETITL